MDEKWKDFKKKGRGKRGIDCNTFNGFVDALDSVRIQGLPGSLGFGHQKGDLELEEKKRNGGKFHRNEWKEGRKEGRKK